MIWLVLKPTPLLSTTFNFCSYSPRKLGLHTVPHLSSNANFCSFNDIASCQNIHNRSFLWITRSYSGFTSELNNLLNAFAYSVATRRRFLVDGHTWNYGPFESYFDIYQSGMSPYVKSSTQCSDRTFVMLAENHIQNEQTDHIMLLRDKNGLFDLLNSVVGNFHENIAPILSIQRKRQVAHFLWHHLSSVTYEFVRTVIDQSHMDLTLPFYALHIRRGDKLTGESPKKLAIEDYIKGIETLQQQAKLHDANVTSKSSQTDAMIVFVASDTRSVIQQIKTMRPNWHLIYLTYGEQLRQAIALGHNQTEFNLLNAEVKLNVTRMFIAELDVMTNAKGVVCTMSSNVCRLVQILRHQSEESVYSLDERWHPN